MLNKILSGKCASVRVHPLVNLILSVTEDPAVTAAATRAPPNRVYSTYAKLIRAKLPARRKSMLGEEQPAAGVRCSWVLSSTTTATLHCDDSWQVEVA